MVGGSGEYKWRTSKFGANIIIASRFASYSLLEIAAKFLPEMLKCKCGNKSKSVQIQFVLKLSRRPGRARRSPGIPGFPVGSTVHVYVHHKTSEDTVFMHTYLPARATGMSNDNRVPNGWKDILGKYYDIY